VVATLLDGMDVVVVRLPRGVRSGVARRLQARARERGAVLLVRGTAERFEPELVVTGSNRGWQGLTQGAGHLRARLVGVEVAGRRAAARPRRGVLWLPDDDGVVRADGATVVTLARRGAG
jgi:hypothetical protein